MFANIIRTQARNALASCRPRISMAGAVVQLVSRRPTQAFVAVSRPLSTSRIVRNDYETDNYARAVPKKEPTDTLYLGNLPFSIEEQDIKEKFSVYGEIHSCRIALKPDGSTRGFAHIQFVNKEDAIAAFESVAEEPMYIMDRDVRVDYAPVRTRAVQEPYHKLFFQNFEGDETMLRNAAQEFESSILSVFFLKHAETGDLTGKGFIDFMTVSRATEALERLNGQRLSNGTSLNLSFAHPPRVRSDDGGQRGGPRSSYGGSGDWGGGRRSTEYSGGGRGGRGNSGSRGRGGGYGGGGRSSQGGRGRGGEGGARDNQSYGY
ncbi:hypothetical protein BDZ94DRAFT_1318032 [Collybia nuda]|uniref:RRM domain-containing protein n=1 Tax=Collybia nuda TaxID=64659 RepID=A0A9P6CNK7_9AGAR|nr:hypothetical protein BDZ94DRAFT_1318032 [Collybia nuda]